MDLNIGDIVKLKSSGPNMTIKFYNNMTGYYECVWFTTDNKILSQNLPKEALEKIS